jgi:hypothetical protein
MKRVFFILNFIFIIFGLNAKSYSPYPIIFAHGVGVSSATWGVEATSDRSDSIIEDNVKSGSTFDHFLELMQPYILADDYLYNPGYPAYPNRDLLEIINFDNTRGSIDRNSGYEGPYKGQGDELWHRIKEVLDEYYGEGQWEDDPGAKVILASDSRGSLMVGKLQFYFFSFTCV